MSLSYQEMTRELGCYKVLSYCGLLKHVVLIVIPNKSKDWPNVVLLGNIIGDGQVRITKIADNSWNKPIHTFEKLNHGFTFVI